MSDSKTNRVPAKIAESAMEALRDRAYQIRKDTGQTVTLGALLDQAVEVFVSAKPQLVAPKPGANPYTQALEDLLNNGDENVVAAVKSLLSPYLEKPVKVAAKKSMRSA